MALSDPITLRLHVDQKRRYEDEAARRQLPLTTYLRRRLEEGDEVSGQLAELRRLIVAARSEPTPAARMPRRRRRCWSRCCCCCAVSSARIS